MAKINPYIHFDGKTEEAFNFYRSVFGGEFLSFMRWKELPEEMGMANLSDADKERIMHIKLTIGSGDVLMGDDFLGSSEDKFPSSGNASIASEPESRKEADELFHALSKGGKIEMPLADAFWGGYFGMCYDKFGIGWMINYDNSKG